MEKVDITIIGAGVIGLAVSYSLADTGKNIMLIEKTASFGNETSSRNSEVIHAGLYYTPGSLKAETCIKGKSLLYSLCEEHGIPYKNIGKLIVGTAPEEIKKIEEIFENAKQCGVDDLTFLDEKDIRKMEPNVNSKMGIYSPSTGIIDSHSLMKFFCEYSRSRNVEFAYNIEVVGLELSSGRYIVTVKEPDGETFSFESDKVINASGFSSDKIAEMAGIDIDKYDYRIKPSKGQYFRISNPKKFSIGHLIYPPPSKVDLGIHVTPDLAGGLRLGPDSKYVDTIDYNIDEESNEVFFNSVSRYLDGLDISYLVPDTAGIRAKVQGPDDDFRDFIINEESEKGLQGMINLVGIESPGLTACLAIAEKVTNLI